MFLFYDTINMKNVRAKYFIVLLSCKICIGGITTINIILQYF